MAEQLRPKVRAGASKKGTTSPPIKEEPVEPLASLPDESANELESGHVIFVKRKVPELATEDKNKISSLENSVKNTSPAPLNEVAFQPFPSDLHASSELEITSPASVLNDLAVIASAKPNELRLIPTMEEINRAKQDPIAKLIAEYNQLSTMEHDILDIAKAVLKKKRYEATISADRVEMMSPLVEQLYSKSIAKLLNYRGYTKEQIFTTIQNLIDKQWIVTDQRRTREEILEAETLQKVLRFIHDHPGTHARDINIEKELEITRNPFIKHVMVLEAFGLIRTKKIGRTQNYFLIDVPESFDDFVVLFSNPIVPDILKLLITEFNIGLSEIARRLGVYHGAIQYHIKTFIEMQIVIKEDTHLRVNRQILEQYNALYKHPPFTSFFSD